MANRSMTVTRAIFVLVILLGLPLVLVLAIRQTKTDDRESEALTRNRKTIAVDIERSNQYEAADEWVRIVEFSPGGEYLATVADSIRIWRMLDGALLQTLDHQNSIQGVDFSPDGKLLLSGSIDMTVRLWRVLDGALLSTMDIPQITSNSSDPEMTSSGNSGLDPTAVTSVAFSPDGKTLAAGIERGRVFLWDASTLELLDVLDLDTEFTVNSLDFSPDSKFIAAGTSAGSIEIWDLVQGNRAAILQEDRVVWSVQFSYDGMEVLAAVNDETVRIWDVNGPLRHTFTGNAPINNAQFLFEREIIIGGDSFGNLYVWNILNEELILIRDDLGVVTWLDYDSENQLLATTGPDRGYVSIWNVIISSNHKPQE